MTESALDRAAEAADAAAIAIRMVWSDVGPTTSDVLAANVVRFLAAAGLLVTDETRAVLDAAESIHRRRMAGKPTRGAYVTLNHAVAAHLASQQGENP